MRHLCLILLPLLVAACAGPAGPQTAEAPDPLAKSQAQGAGVQCEPGKEHWRSPGPPKRGGVWRRSGGNGVNIMLHLDITGPGQNPQSYPQVYRGLVKFRGCYYEDTVTAPDLAKSWEMAPDGLTWIFPLRDDVQWHNKPPVNGRQFTSADVLWTVDHVKKGGGLRSYWEGVELEAQGDYAVVMRMRQPDAEFLGKLADHGNPMVPREVKEQYGDFKQVAIGTGAYMLKEYRTSQFASLVRNPDWKELGADGKPLPYIDELQAVGFGDYAAEVAAIRTNQIDLNSNTGFRKFEDDALRQANPKLQFFADVAATPWSLFLNFKKKPLDDVRVRRALSLAIDREEILIRNGGGAVLSGFLPPAIAEHAWSQEKVRERFKPDRDQAKKLLAEAGFGPGQLKLHTKSVDRYIQDAEVVQANLKAAGIDAGLTNEGAAGVAVIFTQQDWETVWSGQSPSSNFADRWLGILATGASQNYFNYSDPKVDALVAAQRREMEPTKRKQIIDELQEYLYDQMPFIPGISLVYYRYYSCQVKNMKPTHFNHNVDGLAQAWLDPMGC